MSNVNQRQALEVAVIRSMLHALRGAGFRPSYVYDGEEETKIPPHASAPEAADRVLTLALNLDECRVGFRTEGTGERVGSVLLVFGNDGYDVISDWGWVETPAGERFSETLDEVSGKADKLGTRAACDTHTWAWVSASARAHGGCITCGRHTGEGTTSRYFREGKA